MRIDSSYESIQPHYSAPTRHITSLTPSNRTCDSIQSHTPSDMIHNAQPNNQRMLTFIRAVNFVKTFIFLSALVAAPAAILLVIAKTLGVTTLTLETAAIATFATSAITTAVFVGLGTTSAICLLLWFAYQLCKK